jgi:hypothetical protein
MLRNIIAVALIVSAVVYVGWIVWRTRDWNNNRPPNE